MRGDIVRSNIVADRLLGLSAIKTRKLKEIMMQFEVSNQVSGFAQALAPHKKDEMLSKVISIKELHYEFTKVKKIAEGYHLIVIRDNSKVIESISRADQSDKLLKNTEGPLK